MSVIHSTYQLNNILSSCNQSYTKVPSMFYFMWTGDENLLLKAYIVTTFEVEPA